ncbi:MAG: hypothetical protein NXY57DRAFT_907468 [Lentinula lateritia]|nr:MAG: hypothetical protein NXY57DRAFT_907468 [Lentinula lateritia]
MMASVGEVLELLNIPFDVIGNRIRCFPHVVNIAVKTGLQHLTTIVNAAHDKDLEGTDNFLSARSLITAVRGSGQCCEEFKQIIKNGNISGGWGDFKQQLRVVELLKDVDTRWSSTFLMIDRLLELWLPVKEFLNRHPELEKHRLNGKQIEVLLDIQEYLSYAHMVQELLSAQRTPTLSVVLPLYCRFADTRRQTIVFERAHDAVPSSFSGTASH